MRKALTKQNAFKLAWLKGETIEQFQTKIYNNFERRGYVLSVEEYNEMRGCIYGKTFCKGKQQGKTYLSDTWFMTYLVDVDKFQFIIQKHYYKEL